MSAQQLTIAIPLISTLQRPQISPGVLHLQLDASIHQVSPLQHIQHGLIQGIGDYWNPSWTVAVAILFQALINHPQKEQAQVSSMLSAWTACLLGLRMGRLKKARGRRSPRRRIQGELPRTLHACWARLCRHSWPACRPWVHQQAEKLSLCCLHRGARLL